MYQPAHNYSTEDLTFLQLAEVQELLSSEVNLVTAPFDLRKRFSLHQTNLIINQIKGRAKAALKTPVLLKAGGLFIPGLLEQATNERIAGLFTDLHGGTAFDLTFGLGVDSFAMTRRFSQVCAFDVDDVALAFGQFNAQRLSINNLRLYHGDAAFDLKPETLDTGDFFFIDPARRNAQSRNLRLTDYAPDPLTIIKLLSGRRLLVKLSPMFDPFAARLLPHLPEKVIVVSLNHECKGIYLFFNSKIHDYEKIQFEARIALKNQDFYYYRTSKNITLPKRLEATYLYEPDVAIYVARLFPSFFERHFTVNDGITNSEGYIISDTFVQDFVGKCYCVINVLPLKELKSYLKANRIKQANCTKKNFSQSIAALRVQFSIGEGGETTFLFTQVGNKPIVYHAKRIL